MVHRYVENPNDEREDDGGGVNIDDEEKSFLIHQPERLGLCIP